MFWFRSFIMRYVRSMAKEFLFNSSLDVFREALAADTVSQSAEILIASASRENGEFWMDVMIIASALLVIILTVNCIGHMFCWFCVSMPRSAWELEKMRKGEMDFQIEAKRAREERKRRQEAGLEEKPISIAKDMAMVMEAMGEVRQRLAEKGVDVDELLEPPPVATAAEAATAAQDNYKRTSKRCGIRPVATSALRGFPTVDILMSSPSQKYLLVSCRNKRKTILFPQNNDKAFMSEGKDLIKRVQEGTAASVEGALAGAMANGDKEPEVYSAAFTSDDTRLVIGERGSDRFFALLLGGSTLNVLWSCKMPDRRLVSSLPRWNMVSADSFVSLTNKDCELELFTCTPGGEATAHKEKFKVGTATAWSQVNDKVAVAGSFLREPRLARITCRPGTGALSIESAALFPNPIKVRVSALALVVKGVPEFNTRNYLIVFLESGACSVYDVDSLTRSNVPETCATFTDTDHATIDANEPLSISCCVAGKAYQERLLIALVSGRRVTVYGQKGFGAKFEMELVHELFSPQDSAAVKEVAFLQNGRGIATCGKDECPQMRMFAFRS